MLYSFLMATLIAVSPAGENEVYLHSDKKSCENGYYAELVSPKFAVEDTGCWVNVNHSQYFLVRWNSSGTVVRYSKEGTRPVISV